MKADSSGNGNDVAVCGLLMYGTEGSSIFNMKHEFIIITNWWRWGRLFPLNLSDTITISDSVVNSVSVSKSDTVVLSDSLAKSIAIAKSDRGNVIRCDC